jgi:hypothetical protein
MLIDMIATISAGAGLGGIVLILRRFLWRGLPGWVLPAGIGAGMIGFAAWNEYTWYARTTAALPQGVTVVAAMQDRSILQPWSFVWPATTRFLALDGTAMQSSATNPEIRQAEVMVVQRWMATQRVPVGFDCATGEQADLTDGTTMAPDGTLSQGEWITAAPGDPLQAAACQANGSSG